MTHKLCNLANKHVAHGRIGLEGPESGNRTARSAWTNFPGLWIFGRESTRDLSVHKKIDYFCAFPVVRFFIILIPVVNHSEISRNLKFPGIFLCISSIT